MNERWWHFVRLWILIVGLFACSKGPDGQGDTTSTRVTSPEPLAAAWYACEEEAFEVELTELLPLLPPVDVSEQREQLRDWLWTLALARHAAQPPEELTFDLRPAPWQKGPLAAGGPSRSIVLDTNEMVVMIPTGSEEMMKDALLRAFDRQSLGRGDIDRVTVYRHGDVDIGGRAWMCRLPELSSERLVSAEFGVRSATVRTEAELAAVLEGGLDLRYAMCSSEGLKVGGRQRVTTAAAPIGIEEIRELRAGVQGLHEANSLGFSLDPTPHPAKMAARLLELEAAIRLNMLERALTGRDPLAEDLIRAELAVANEATRSRYVEDLSQMAKRAGPELVAQQALHQAHDLSIFGRILRGRSAIELEEDFMLRAAGWAAVTSAEQCPRYIGPLRGTKVGMVMYYTDLLAKLSSQGKILGPAAVVAEPWALNPCELPGLAISDGRLWLEPAIGDMQKHDDSLSFTPEVITINGKQKDLESGGSKEIDPPLPFQQYLNRWNVAREEILAWEPQYEHLNQIFKWNAVLLHPSTAACMGFLASPTTSDLTLDEWVAEQPNLRLPDVKSLGFESTNECLPVLVTEPFAYCRDDGAKHSFGFAAISGGVTSISKLDVAQKIPRLRSVERIPLRNALNGKPVQAKLAADGKHIVAKLGSPAPRATTVDNILGDVQPLAKDIESRLGQAITRDELQALNDTVRDVIAVRRSAGLDVKPLVERQARIDIATARAQQLGPRAAIPDGDITYYIKTKGSPPIPGTPPPNADYFSVVLEPPLVVENPLPKADFERAVMPADGASRNHFRVIRVQCEDQPDGCEANG